MTRLALHQYPRDPEALLIDAEERASRLALTRAESRASEREHRKAADDARAYRPDPKPGARDAAERLFGGEAA